MDRELEDDRRYVCLPDIFGLARRPPRDHFGLLQGPELDQD